MSFISKDLFAGVPLRDTRRARLVRGTLRFASSTQIPIVIRNLSERGLGVSCRTAPPQPGETVVVTLPGSPELDGIVRWTQDMTFGIELTGSVDTQEIASALQREQARLLEKSDWTVSSLHRIHAPRETGPRRRI
jgi:hypothetical protein